MMNNVMDDEEELNEKVELACGVVNFLKSLHASESLRMNLKGYK